MPFDNSEFFILHREIEDDVMASLAIKTKDLVDTNKIIIL